MPALLKQLARAAGVLAGSAIIACDGSGLLAPPAGLSHAAATSSCGAADGATVALYLRDSEITGIPLSEPYLQVSVSASLDALRAGNSWRIGEHPDNWAAFRSSPESAEHASSGVVAITSAGPDTIDGNLTLTFPSGRQVRGGFQARRFASLSSFFCG
jgi:hypothetical protein